MSPARGSARSFLEVSITNQSTLVPCKARKHNRSLLEDVRFCLCQVSRLASVSLRVSSSVRISTALKLICVYSLHFGRTICKVPFSFIVFHHEHSRLSSFTHALHPRLKKQRGDILRCFSSRLCYSSLFRRTCGLTVRFVIRS